MGRILHKESRQLPSPSKDYVSLELTEEKLTIHHFRISPANLKMTNGANSVRTDVATLDEFLEGDMNGKVEQCFGKRTLERLLSLARGDIDHLERLTDELKIKILSHLPIESIEPISTVSQSFRRLCESDQFWRLKFADSKAELVDLGEQIGFRNLFFMSKMDVQRHLRKVRQSQTFITEMS